MKLTDQETLAFAQRMVQRTAEHGAFLLTGAEPVNPMAIGWAGAAWMWQKPTMIIVVRESRYSHQLLENNGSFTISAPAAGTMAKALQYCGTVSGRDADKCKELALSILQPVAGRIGGLSGCELHVECRTLYRMEGPLTMMEQSIVKQWYPNGDTHMLYFGEILAAYETP